MPRQRNQVLDPGLHAADRNPPLSALEIELLPARFAKLARSYKEEQGEFQGETDDFAARVAIDRAQQSPETPGIGNAWPMANLGRLEKAAEALRVPMGDRVREDLLLALIFIGVVIFRMAQLVLIVDLELLGGFRVLVDLAHGCLILTWMFIVSVIVVIFRAGRWVLGDNQSLKVARGGFCVFSGHSGILLEIKIAGAQLVWHLKRVSARVGENKGTRLVGPRLRVRTAAISSLRASSR